MGKVHGSLARAGKVKAQTPKVEKQEKKKNPRGRAKKRMLYNRRFVNVTTLPPGGKRRMCVSHTLSDFPHNWQAFLLDVPLTATPPLGIPTQKNKLVIYTTPFVLGVSKVLGQTEHHSRIVINLFFSRRISSILLCIVICHDMRSHMPNP
ncbi:ribosomal protein S30-domain-containing protein [Boletus edulis]|nr:ribosomal protein S30-domain-containing protein [Boletus edulis]